MILLADSEGCDQTARMRSLIWAFAVRIYPRHVFPWRGPNYTFAHAINSKQNVYKVNPQSIHKGAQQLWE